MNLGENPTLSEEAYVVTVLSAADVVPVFTTLASVPAAPVFVFPIKPASSTPLTSKPSPPPPAPPPAPQSPRPLPPLAQVTPTFRRTPKVRLSESLVDSNLTAEQDHPAARGFGVACL